MSLPANDHSDLSAPSLPAPGAAPTLAAPPTRPGDASLPAPDGAPTGSTGPTAPALTIDGDAPRLGSATPAGPTSPTSTLPISTSRPPLDEASPTIDPSLLPSLPSLPAAVVTPAAGVPAPDEEVHQSAPTDHSVTDTTDTPSEPEGQADTLTEPVHPMAHLMPEKTAPSEASIKAAQLRAAKKAKARKIKLAVTVGALVVAVVAGPPLWSWLGNAINESGGTTTEQPAD